jgi:thiazole synthase ThiGH ThiG subunit
MDSLLLVGAIARAKAGLGLARALRNAAVGAGVGNAVSNLPDLI